MIKCLLCLNQILIKNSLKISTKNEEWNLTIEDLIKNHFWFFDKILAAATPQDSQDVICKICFEKLESFYEFFCAVKSNYNVNDTDDLFHPTERIDSSEVFVKDEVIDAEVIIKQDVDDEDFLANVFSPFDDENSSPEDPMTLENSKISLPRPDKPKRIKTVIQVDKPDRPKRKALKTDPYFIPKKRKTEEEMAAMAQRTKPIFELSSEDIDVLRPLVEFKCEICSDELNASWMDVKYHYRKFHKITGFIRCCGRKMDRASEVKDHADWHLNPHIFQCHVCGKSAISRYHLKLHEETHIKDEDRKFSCPKCDKKFVNQYNVNMHSKVHEKEGKVATIPCKLCDKLYKTEYQLKMHIHYCHKTQQSWICHICSKVLKSKHTLDIHVKNHTNPDDPMECDICGHILKNRRRFNIHMAKHKSAEKGPYTCEQGCGQLFPHRPAMLSHIAFVHTKNRFNCSHCGKEFKHKKSLEEHEVTQHGGLDLYSCPFCERTFKNSANMHSHKKKTHPEEYKKLPAPSYLRGSLGDYCDN